MACFGADVCAADPLCQSHFTTPDIGDWESRGVRVLQVVETARAVVATVKLVLLPAQLVSGQARIPFPNAEDARLAAQAPKLRNALREMHKRTERVLLDEFDLRDILKDIDQQIKDTIFRP